MPETPVANLQKSLNWIDTNWATYSERRLDYRRGSLPSNSLPEHVAGSGEPAMPEQDDLDVKVSEGWTKIRSHLETARIALRGVESEMAFLVNATKRPEDPEPRVCGNPHCPDARVFSMIGNDRPHDGQGRCDACRKFYGRNARERTTINAYRIGSDVEVAG